MSGKSLGLAFQPSTVGIGIVKRMNAQKMKKELKNGNVFSSEMLGKWEESYISPLGASFSAL